MGTHRKLALFWTGYASSQIGTSAWRLALPWVVLLQTGRVWSLVAVSLASIVPELLLGPLAGALADRLPRLPTLLLLDGFRCTLYVACFLALFATGTSQTAIYALTAVQVADTSAGILFTSARAPHA
ncbi:hypothetical protein [Streptomyces torulosus]|uniref:hypothetical protein n=1 Tax=Streptomyces torulosus TaxID=68276 RepID=UPI0014720EB8|nr:hypothetical protein [Streptomyces torulosus]